MPNTFAYVALFASPVAVFLVFRFLSLQWAVATAIIGGYLLLPQRPAIDLPFLPALDKDLLPGLSALVFAAVAAGRLQQDCALAGRLGKPTPPLPFVAPGLWPRTVAVNVLVVVLVLGGFGTSLTNTDPLLVGGDLRLPGLRIYDAFSLVMSLISTILPLLLARKYLGDPEGHRILLTTLALAGFAYCFPALLEIRISPQLSNIIYGFFPHEFAQHVRNGGYRPAVFLNHALWIGIFFAMAFLAALAVMRISRDASRLLWFSIAGFILATLFLSKTLGALVMAVMLAPVVLFVPRRAMLLLCVLGSAIVLLYPLLRGAGLIPIDAILSMAAEIDPARAGSLEFPIRNEDEQPARGLRRQWFGWGGWGRGKLYEQWTGTMTSVADGVWIIQILIGGWVRYLGFFGLMIVPMVLLFFSRRVGELAISTALLCVVLLVNLLDMIPNGTLTPLTWLLVGGLVGRLEYRAAADQGTTAEPGAAGRLAMAGEVPLSRYTRTAGPHRARGTGPATASRRVLHPPR